MVNFIERFVNFEYNPELSAPIKTDDVPEEFLNAPQEVWVGYNMRGNTPEESHEFIHVVVWLASWGENVFVAHLPLPEGQTEIPSSCILDRSKIRSYNPEFRREPDDFFPDELEFNFCVGIWSYTKNRGNLPTSNFVLAMNEHSVAKWTDTNDMTYMDPKEIKNNIRYSDDKKRYNELMERMAPQKKTDLSSDIASAKKNASTWLGK